MRCPFCRDRVVEVDYKDVAKLTPFLTTRNGIKARRGKLNRTGRRAPGSGLCRKHQRQVAVAVKRARYLALLPLAVDSRELDGWRRPLKKGGAR
jgi:small subunit ribosomal protein S18